MTRDTVAIETPERSATAEIEILLAEGEGRAIPCEGKRFPRTRQRFTRGRKTDMCWKTVFAGMVAALGLASTQAAAQQLTIWHDLGDNGTKWLAQVADEFARTHPGVTLRPTSFPTDQWFGRVIGALNTDTAPDLIFNNYERVIRVANQTGKVMDLKSTLAEVGDKAFISAEHLRIATYAGKLIILPIQPTQMAFGVRKSWLDKTGGSFPKTWDDAKRAAQKFQDAKLGFGFALEAAKPRDLIHILDLFNFGAGVPHTLVDPEGRITIDEPRHAKVLEEFLKTYSTYKLVPPDTINYSFTEMYQVIEGGKAGMFRVGDWNVGKWDGPATLGGDYLVGPWPQMFPDTPSGVVIGGMRGVAVPENSPNKVLALEFAKFLLAPVAQQASLAIMGSAIRQDLDISALSAHQQAFAKPSWRLYAYDFPEAAFPWYPELEAAFHRKLLAAIADPPADYAKFIAETAAEMRALAKDLAAKKG
jgi:ABC-type glycerol-3-phosphate transport system substrate-binding protein